MIQANMHEAKTRLSKLIAQAQAGEEVVIARNGVPVARLTPVDSKPPFRLGMFAHKLVGPLPTEEEWREMDREIAVEFEAATDLPEPDREPFEELSPAEEARIAALSTEELLAELLARPS